MPSVSFPDITCPISDGTVCIMKRIANTTFSWTGIRCNGADIGGKERCKIYQRAMKEGLTFFLKEQKSWI